MSAQAKAKKGQAAKPGAPKAKAPKAKAPKAKPSKPGSKAVPKARASKAAIPKAPASKAAIPKAAASKAAIPKAPASKGAIPKAPASKGAAPKAPASKAALSKAPSPKPSASKLPPERPSEKGLEAPPESASLLLPVSVRKKLLALARTKLDEYASEHSGDDGVSGAPDIAQDFVGAVQSADVPKPLKVQVAKERASARHPRLFLATDVHLSDALQATRRPVTPELLVRLLEKICHLSWGAEERKARPKASRGGRPTDGVNWAEVQAHPAEAFRGYDPSGYFQTGEWIAHTKFGRGLVVGEAESKIRVRFADGERVLARTFS